MTNFEINTKYSCRSICDHEAVFEFTITKRSIKSVWIGQDRFKIFKDGEGKEFIFPQGKYSMCPILRSENKSS